VQLYFNEMLCGLILNIAKSKSHNFPLNLKNFLNPIVNEFTILFLSRRGRGIGWMRLLFFGKTYFYYESFGSNDICQLADDLKVLFVIFWCHCSYIFTVTNPIIYYSYIVSTNAIMCIKLDIPKPIWACFCKIGPL